MYILNIVFVNTIKCTVSLKPRSGSSNLVESTVCFAGGQMAAGSPFPDHPVKHVLHWSLLSNPLRPLQHQKDSGPLLLLLLLLTVWQASLNPSLQMT